MIFDPTQPYKCVDGVLINLTADEITEQETLQSTATTQIPLIAMNQGALAALAKSDETMRRIQEAVSLGLTTWTTADVIAWVTYRRTLRPLITSMTVQSLPSQPNYPANT